MGFQQGALTQVVFFQTVLVLLVAYPVGMAIAQGIAAFIHWASPLYLIQTMEPASLIQTFLAGLAFALLGAIVPLRTIARLDPMMVFQGS